uniref:Uncharacterized protein n=1 Tax=Eutreptiella gymnastica TaxID=73025 RepID=A0A7S4FVB8_9EUGL
MHMNESSVGDHLTWHTCHMRLVQLLGDMEKLVCCHLDLSSYTGHLCRCIWNCEGPPGTKGHCKVHEVGANCIVLLMVGRSGLCNFCCQSVCSSLQVIFVRE